MKKTCRYEKEVTVKAALLSGRHGLFIEIENQRTGGYMNVILTPRDAYDLIADLTTTALVTDLGGQVIDDIAAELGVELDRHCGEA